MMTPRLRPKISLQLDEPKFDLIKLESTIFAMKVAAASTPKRKAAGAVNTFDYSKVKFQSPKKAKNEPSRLVKVLEARQGVVLVFVVEQRKQEQDAYAQPIYGPLGVGETLEFGSVKLIAKVVRRHPSMMNRAVENAENSFLRRAMLAIQDNPWTAENKHDLAEEIKNVSTCVILLGITNPLANHLTYLLPVSQSGRSAKWAVARTRQVHCS